MDTLAQAKGDQVVATKSRFRVQPKWLVWAFLLLFLIPFSISFAAAATPPTAPSPLDLAQPGQPLTLATRLACQTAIEEVYWSHRTWPPENPGPKPALFEVMSAAAIEAKVMDSLARSQALTDIWQQPITALQLQAEINRQASNSQRPELLTELWSALHNNPVLVAECLARPALTDRLIHNWFTADTRFADDDFATWWANYQAEVSPGLAFVAGEYSLPIIAAARAPLADNTWQATASIPKWPLGKAVWTGTEMLFLGESTTQGHRYNPATDTWDDMTTINAPHRVSNFTAVWSGTEMIIWGGCNGSHEFCTSSAGGRYNPSTDSWTATSTVNTPGPRRHHGAVWTGTEMIVWGGCTENSNGNQNCAIILNDGGRYNPTTNSWQPVSTSGAPTARTNPELVWTDDEMILWSGANMANAGGRYNPTTNTWQSISTVDAPAGRSASLVWTGTEMIAWGGCIGSPFCTNGFNSGGRYNPDSNSWTPTSTTNAPGAVWEHKAVWIGNEMVVWGGYNGTTYTNTGSRYDPIGDTWTPTNTLNAPVARGQYQLFWTGSEILIWGGWGASGSTQTRSGGRYNPVADSWTPISTIDSNSSRTFHKTIWTGVEMIAWGGVGDGWVSGLNTGRIYDPVTDTWAETSTVNAPSPRDSHTALWTGVEMLIWGGNTVSWPTPGDGGRYNLMTNSWTPVNTTNAPEAPAYHTAIWTGTEMIIFGGSIWDSPTSNVSGRYQLSTDSWLPMTTLNVPSGRDFHTAVWTGNEMIIWGGNGNTGMLADGGRYDPVANTWTPISMTNAPLARTLHTAIWTGNEMLIWGGANDYSPWILLNSGGRYNPATNSWTATTMTGAPLPAARHTAVWTGDEMIVWGGCYDSSNCLHGTHSGGRYDPQNNSWSPVTATGVPEGRFFHTAVWAGNEMIVWGGETDNNGYGYTGGRYYAATSGNNAPQAHNDTYNVTANTTLTVTAPGVLGNDSDPDNNPLTVSLVSGPAHGVLVFQANGSFTYTPVVGFSGTDNFTYQASDGSKVSNVAVVGITIHATNSVPVAVNDSYITTEGTPLVVVAPGVLGNDHDPDGDPLAAAVVGNPTHGSLSLNADGSFSYAPEVGFSGSDIFTYIVSDGQGGSDEAVVTITISDPFFFIYIPMMQNP